MSEIDDDYINLQKTDKLIKKINNILKYDLDWNA